MSLMAGPSQAGEWTAVVGVPEFGFDAALAFGVDLGRCIVVPEPGEHWLSVTAGSGRGDLPGAGPAAGRR